MINVKKSGGAALTPPTTGERAASQAKSALHCVAWANGRRHFAVPVSAKSRRTGKGEAS